MRQLTAFSFERNVAPFGTKKKWRIKGRFRMEE
jgi:hypothetical protein